MPPPAPLLEPGFRLDRYELLCRIGQGGMATVWLARTANSHGEERLVAIKTILPGLAADDTVRTMLLDEARIAKAIDHPNVAHTLEVGQLWDMPYMVLELVGGESVDQLCRALAESSLTVPAAIVVRIVADAALGLHEAHELASTDGDNLGIVHRDVSPPNILVDELGCARVIDFGVAKAAERFTPETASGVMKGRVPYMSPEHASGGAVDRRSDIWSLGVVAYYMLAGRYPFDGANDAVRLIRILGTDGPDPLPESVAPAVRDVVLRALSKDPDERYSTAAELASALEISKLPATHEEVAAFFRDTVGEAMDARHALVENALAAADARARAREMLDGPAPVGGSRSYRPPPVISDDDGHAAENGTLGTVTRSQGPAVKKWVPWVTAAVIGMIVIVAFALGSFTARGPLGPIATPGPGVGGVRAGAMAPADAGAAGSADAGVPKAEAEVVAAKTNAAVDAPPSPDRTTPAKVVPTWTTRPPPPGPKAASSAVKPPEHEDTIF